MSDEKIRNELERGRKGDCANVNQLHQGWCMVGRNGPKKKSMGLSIDKMTRPITSAFSDR